MKRLILLLACIFCASEISAQIDISIGRISCVSPGHTASLPIYMNNPSPGTQFGGFELQLAYSTSLTFLSAQPGQVLTDCGWEYFTVQVPGPARVRLLAIADLNNGASHPTCYGDRNGTIATLNFQVAPDSAIQTNFLPIKWIWYGCT